MDELHGLDNLSERDLLICLAKDSYYSKKSLQEINDHLKALNGRIRDCEQFDSRVLTVAKLAILFLSIGGGAWLLGRIP